MLNKKEKKDMKNLRTFNIIFIILFIITMIGLMYLYLKIPVYIAGSYYAGMNKNSTLCEILERDSDGEYCIISKANISIDYYSHYFNCSWSRLRVDTNYDYIPWTEYPICWWLDCEHVKIIHRRNE